MRQLISGIATVLLLGTQAGAADMDTPVGTDWSGSYLGVHTGYLWGETEVEEGGVIVESGAKTDGWVGGIYLGHNWQRDELVFGIDADAGLADVSGTGRPPPPELPNTYDMKWNAHLRLRAGVAPGQGNVHLFAAAGVAFANFSFTDGDTGEGSDATYVAPSVGGGAELKLSDSLTARMEAIYDLYSMGSGLVALDDYEARLQDTLTVRAGLSLDF